MSKNGGYEVGFDRKITYRLEQNIVLCCYSLSWVRGVLGEHQCGFLPQPIPPALASGATFSAGEVCNLPV